MGMTLETLSLQRFAALSHVCWRILPKNDSGPLQGHKVECNDPKTEKTKIIKHSTSYFPGTGKRHGLVVVSGNGTQGNPWGGKTEGYSLDIHIRIL